LQARDRSRVALAADAMGAAGLGIRNILCLSGDHRSCFGPSPSCKPDQFGPGRGAVDLDAAAGCATRASTWTAATMKHRPQWFLGAAGSPFGAPPKYEAIRMPRRRSTPARSSSRPSRSSITATSSQWLEALDRRSLLEQGLHPGGHRAAQEQPRPRTSWPRTVPGVVHAAGRCVAAHGRLRAPTRRRSRRPASPSPELLAEAARQTPGIHGVHIMAVHWEEVVPRLIAESGLPRLVEW
jgi:methylenetetrahydrofolate reductase (NADPH)